MVGEPLSWIQENGTSAARVLTVELLVAGNVPENTIMIT
jgi:hypothetical protein